MTKSELRNIAKEKDKALSEKERAEIDKKICERFFSLDFSECERVFVYVSFRHEVETRPIIEKFLRENRKVYVPLCKDGAVMEAKRIRDLSELSPGMYGIPEPPEDAESSSPEELSLIITPGLAFGEDCSRLGKGAGYYDRFLARAENAYVTALCREANIYDTVPCDEHDRAVDMVITEERVIRNCVEE